MSNLTIYTFHATIHCRADRRNIKRTKVTQEGPNVSKAMDLAESKVGEEYPNCDISLSFGNRTPDNFKKAGHDKCEAHKPGHPERLSEPQARGMTVTLGEMVGLS